MGLKYTVTIREICTTVKEADIFLIDESLAPIPGLLCCIAQRSDGTVVEVHTVGPHLGSGGTWFPDGLLTLGLLLMIHDS